MTTSPTANNPNKIQQNPQMHSLLAYHLRELATMTPLSTEKLSRGKPAMFHA